MKQMAVAKMAPRQRGMSIISLMIGMLISMIGVLAGIVLYQNMVKVSLKSRADAAQDGQLASAMLSLQLELQSAGFGIVLADNPGPHWGLVSGAGATQTLYWRYQDTSVTPAVVVCRAFRIEDTAVDARRQLQLLQPTTASSCTLNAVLTALPGGWGADPNNPPVVLAEFRATGMDGATVSKLPIITLSSSIASCFPYGLGPTADYRMITVTADSAARRAAVDEGVAPTIAPIVYDFCLPNIPG